MAIRFLAGEEVTGTTTFKSGVTGVQTDTVAIFGNVTDTTTGFELYEGSGLKLSSKSTGIRVHGTIRAEKGGNGNPAYTFNDDTTTGMYLTNTGNLRLVNDAEPCLTVRTNFNVEINSGTLKIGSIPAGSSSNAFLINESNIVKSRTAAQVRSDIGAGTGDGTVTSVATGAGLTGGTITGSGTVSVDYGTSGLINDAPGGSGNPDQDDLVLIGKDSSGSGETRSYALVDLPFAPSGTVSGVTSVAVSGGTGISVSGSPITSTGTITVTNSAPDQTVALTGGTGITISGTYPNFTITNSSPSSGGTVTGSGTANRVALWNGTTSLTDSIRLVFGASKTFFNNTTSTPVQMQNDGGVGTAKFEGFAVSNSSNLQITPGTESKPGLNFGMRSGTGAQDHDTGIFSSVANKMEFATGGSERVQISSSGTKLTTLNALSSAASVFLTSDSGVIKTRTAAQVRSDIGAGTGSGTVTSVGITAGTGISVSGSPVTGSGSITVTNSAPDQTVALSAGTGISISGTYPNFTITNSSPSSGGTMSTWKLTADSGGTATIDDAETVDIAGGTNITTVRSGNTVTINTSATTNTGTVTSVGITAGTGISVSGSPVTSSGSITVTNSSPDTGVPAILSNGSTPSLNTGITGAEVRSLIGAGTGSGDITAVVAGAGLTGGASSGSATLDLDIDGTNNYIEMNNDVTPASGDFVPFSDISTNVVRKTTFSDIPLSILNNDASFGTMSNWFITADSGTASQVDQGETVDIQGTAPISTSVSSNTVTLTHDNSGVSAGSYTNANITVNATGHITAASSGSGVTGSGTTNFISKWSSGSALTNSEISDTGSVIQLGLDASNNSTLYLDTTNRKVGFRTTSPGAAFDVNGTIRVRNQLNVGHTTEQNLYVNGNGAAGGQYVKMGNYGNANYFGITSSENQPKYTPAFGPNGKIVEGTRVVTVKISASALNTYHTDAGVQILPSPGSGNIIWPQSIFIYRGAGDPGTGWPSGNNSIGASFYFCDQVNTCSTPIRIANIASGVCKSNTGTWFWGRPVPLPSLNENPNIKWLLDNKNLRFKTASNVNNATMDWYVRIEYIQMNITAGFTNNVDITIT